MRQRIIALSLALLGFCATQGAKADSCNGVSAGANLVANCSFESGSFSGWSGTATTDAVSGVDGLSPYSGAYSAYLGSTGATDTLFQNLSTTAGVLYSIQFALLNDTSPSQGYTNSFQALFGGTSLLNESAVNQGGYTLYKYSALASSNMSQLAFVSRNDGGYFELDSVSVAANSTSVTPEPSSILLLGTGALGLIGFTRRRLKV